MTRLRPPALLLATACSALTALTALSGCSGGDDSPPVTAQASADSSIATWNTVTAIDVLANDSVSRGDKRLTGLARAPANGTAAVVDGRISYRPRDGFYGADTLRYTMASADGTAGAEAEVAITVEAELLLSGTAIDAPLAHATLQFTGAAIAQAVADASGAWQARVRLSDPDGVLRIDASGTGAQQHVRLTSLAAADALTGAAATDGTVGADKAEALTVTHFSTAQAALMARGPAGLPTTAAALATAQAAVDTAAQLDLATLIHLAADEGLALPVGVADTWALATDATAAAALLAQQATADGAAFAQAQARALGAAPAAGLLPTNGTLVTYPAVPNSSGGAVFSLAADGTARVSAHLGSRSARWTQDGDGLVVTLDAPFSSIGFSADEDPVTFQQNEMRTDLSAYRLKRLSAGLVAVSQALTQTMLDGSRAGQVQTLGALADAGDAYRLATDAGTARSLQAADFAVGRRWAGVVQALRGDQLVTDVLEITATGSGRALRAGTTYTLHVGTASFTLAGSDGSQREYLRLGDAGAGGTWFMVFDRSATGDAVTAQIVVLVPQAAALAFDAATAGRTWMFEGLTGQSPSLISLRADGSGTYLGSAATWQVLVDGRLEIVRNRREVDLGQGNETHQTRYTWILLGRGIDGSILVLRRLVVSENVAAPVPEDAPDQIWTVLRYRDVGPAS